jgi:leukotriene-A4 hydrolase
MKMCRTIYRALFKVAPELAKKTFIAHAAFYVRPPSPFSSLTSLQHPIARKMIAKDLGVSL